MDALLPVVRLGVTLYPKVQHGGYFEDLNEREGSLYVPMRSDGTAASEDEAMQLDYTYYEVNGQPCASACYLCREAERAERNNGEGS